MEFPALIRALSRMLNLKLKFKAKNLSAYSKGFTLIELLVVISILGLLAALVVSNMSGVRERARDAQRKSDLKEVQKALEMYKASQSPPAYPAGTSWSNLSVLVPNYIKVLPNDPLNTETGAQYSYQRDSVDPLKYTLKACLENASDPQGQVDSSCSSNKSFIVTEP